MTMISDTHNRKFTLGERTGECHFLSPPHLDTIGGAESCAYVSTTWMCAIVTPTRDKSVGASRRLITPHGVTLNVTMMHVSPDTRRFDCVGFVSCVSSPPSPTISPPLCVTHEVGDHESLSEACDVLGKHSHSHSCSNVNQRPKVSASLATKLNSVWHYRLVFMLLFTVFLGSGAQAAAGEHVSLMLRGGHTITGTSSRAGAARHDHSIPFSPRVSSPHSHHYQQYQQYLQHHYAQSYHSPPSYSSNHGLAGGAMARSPSRIASRPAEFGMRSTSAMVSSTSTTTKAPIRRYILDDHDNGQQAHSHSNSLSHSQQAVPVILNWTGKSKRRPKPTQSSVLADPSVSPPRCPQGPPLYWRSRLNVASKSYLAPVVFYGQLISLAEDFAGRIAATFNLSKLIKPKASGGSRYSHLVKMMDNEEDEDEHKHRQTFVRLYFVHNETAGSSLARESPYCAQPMVDIKERLRTKQNYIVFAHPTIVSYAHPQPSNNNYPQLVTLVAYALPEQYTSNASRRMERVLCDKCAKEARVHSDRNVIHVKAGHNFTIGCRVTGRPQPLIEWLRNGRTLKSRRRVTITTRGRVSKLTISRASYQRDSGVYECRAMNVVSKEPAIYKIRVQVERRKIMKPSKSPGYTTQRAPPASKPKVASSVPPGTLESTTRAPGESSSSTVGASSLETDPIGGHEYFFRRPKVCPIGTYCLNGGTCSLYEDLGEYVCQCPDGYRGQRCESKDITKYPAQDAMLEYDLRKTPLSKIDDKRD